MIKYLHLKKIRDHWRLPTVLFDVFESDDIGTEKLHQHVTKCLSSSGYVGVRTEPKRDVSPLGDYPHGFPLESIEEVEKFISEVSEGKYGPSKSGWWFLVNEAFVQYRWNAVVSLSLDFGRLRMVGEINQKDNAPLREALARSENVQKASDWYGADKAKLLKLLRGTETEDVWFEVSKVLPGERIVFWGMRG